ncbi:MAG: hypothetical protein WDN03_14785 [Rhizomicrobium sp.]
MAADALPHLLVATGTDGYLDTRELLRGFDTDMWFPRYRAVTMGPWKVTAIVMSGSRGYWGKQYTFMGTILLVGPTVGGDSTWMSTTPWEIESQEIGVKAARGHAAVLGLGLGWQAANVALNPNVERVTVVEHDPQVMELVRAQGVFEQLPQEARDKIELVQADANAWRPQDRVDTLLADIWAKTTGENRVRDYRSMQDNIGAAAAYFWGQEVVIWQRAVERLGPKPDLDWPLVRTIIAEDFDLPLIVPDRPDYPQRIAAAGRWWAPKEPR